MYISIKKSQSKRHKMDPAPNGNRTHKTIWSPYHHLKSEVASEGLFVTRELHQDNTQKKMNRNELTLGLGFPVMVTSNLHDSPALTRISPNSFWNSGGRLVTPILVTVVVFCTMCEDSTSRVLTKCDSIEALTSSVQ